MRTDGSVSCWGYNDEGGEVHAAGQGEFASVSAGDEPHLRGEDRRLRLLLGREQCKLGQERWPGPGLRPGEFASVGAGLQPHLRGDDRRLRLLLGP